MVSIGHAKLLVGSSASCTIGGWNAHAANVVASLFVATGQARYKKFRFAEILH